MPNFTKGKGTDQSNRNTRKGEKGKGDDLKRESMTAIFSSKKPMKEKIEKPKKTALKRSVVKKMRSRRAKWDAEGEGVGEARVRATGPIQWPGVLSKKQRMDLSGRRPYTQRNPRKKKKQSR